METRILHKDHLVPLLRRLSRDYRLVAPVRNEYGDTLYSVIHDLDRARIDLEQQPQSSLKPFFFPQTEVLSQYVLDRDKAGGQTSYAFYPQLPENRPTLYFGVRSCDMMAVMYMDLIFFQSRGQDIYYARHRENAVFITIGCNHPFPNCFCNATRTGPFLEYGYDLQLTDIGERYFVETGRARGRKIVEAWPWFFSGAGEQDRRAQFQAALEARGLFKSLVHVDLAIKLLEEGGGQATLFAELSQRCQDCGGCAFICPTCTCFNIHDQPRTDDSGERVRTWDACTFRGFTRMCGDHNPVDVSTQRVRKRFLHKLLHDVRQHGRTSCMGCGRCVGMCFGGVDMIRFISMMCQYEAVQETGE
ncbi:4Fe-4S dicluster domain-containing protein [Desulfolithobacter sp.]